MVDFVLKPSSALPPHDGPVLVCILDGFGENEFKDEVRLIDRDGVLMKRLKKVSLDSDVVPDRSINWPHARTSGF